MCATVAESCSAARAPTRPATRLDLELVSTFGDANRPSAARNGQSRLERPRREVDTVGRQLRDSVRDDRAREVHRLTAAADER
jgi:hypothetical protein